MTIAALFVLEDGPYANLPGVEVWGPSRDARTYTGPWPVVAHPPCERWGRFYFGGPQWLKDGHPRKVLGDDGGCFSSALEAVRRFGGVLEHPAASRAWDEFGLKTPPRVGGWVSAGLGDRGWTCCVDQGHYGHRGQKATWLYAVSCELPLLQWDKAPAPRRRNLVGLSATERRREVRTGTVQLLSKRQRTETPAAFRDLLLDMARTAQRKAA